MSKLLNLRSVVTSNFLTYAFVGVGAGTAFIHSGLHTFLMEKYAGLFQRYEHGFEVDVPEEFETVLSDISDDLQIPIRNPVTKLLPIIGFDTTHFGSTMTRTGAIIGIPVSYFYKSKDEIDHSSLLVGYKSVPWDSEAGQQLEKSLLMSDNAKRYGIAFELAIADTPKLYLHIMCAPMTMVLCGSVNNYFCRAKGLPFRSFAVKVIFYSLLTVFGIGFYFSLKDIATQYCEYSALDKVCIGGEQYILGGVEFYEKLLLKHKALRALLPDGKSDYTMYGDPIYIFRKKHILPTELKSLLEKKLIFLKQSNPS